MSEAGWEISHSVETATSREFAWSYMTKVANWDDPPAEFKLEGAFAEGSRGRTLVPGQAPREWVIRRVDEGASYTLEFPLDGATMSFEWTFAGIAEGRTRLTQRVMLAGKNAAAYLKQVKPAFTASLAPGMEKIAKAIGRAAAEGAAERPPDN